MMVPVAVAMRSRLCWPGVALVVGLALPGCAAQAPGATAAAKPDQATAEIPAGAIPISDELYQVPIGADDDGCPRYRLYSPTRLVAQVVYYRDAAGAFTTDRRQADCAIAPD